MTHPAKLKAFALLFLVSFFSANASAQSFKLLLSFNGADGEIPVDTPLVQGIDGQMYGTTLGGGDNGAGTIFKISAAGKLTTVYSFCALSDCADGNGPYGGLVLGTDGNFYGTTQNGGGSSNVGTVFKITPSGKLTTLHSFAGTDGSTPMAPLIQGRDGYFYGITTSGGIVNAGTIFKISPSGGFTSLHTFGSGEASDPTGPLMQASDGNLYGTSEGGGVNFAGDVFKAATNGSVSILYSFSGPDGFAPASGLVQGSDGALYGVTYSGGANGNGTIFKITLGGTLTTLHNFDETDGGQPIAALIQATDGNFYGTTYGGGSTGQGILFEMTPGGAVSTLHTFDGNDGAQLYAPLVQSSAGSFFGTATHGGADSSGFGTAFRLITGLGPFVKLAQPARRVGQMVGIIGQGFIGASSVSINGVPAFFMIRSGSYIAATIPAGATSGFVTVTTSSGTLKSNMPLTIMP